MFQYARILYTLSKSRLGYPFPRIRYFKNVPRQDFAKSTSSDKRTTNDIRKQVASDNRIPESQSNRQRSQTNLEDKKKQNVVSFADVNKFNSTPAGIPISQYEPKECIIKPMSCPPPTLSEDDQIIATKLATAEARSKSDGLVKDEVCETSQPPKRDSSDTKNSSEGDTKKSSGGGPASSNPPPSGPGGYGKWLLGAVALAFGGLAVYYVYGKNKKDNNLTGGSKSRKSGKGRGRSIRDIQKIPATSSDLPKEVEYLLIGGGTAAFSAFRAIKSHDPKAKVLVLSKENDFPYMRPPLSKELWNSDMASREKLTFRQWNGSVRSVFYEPDSFYMEPKSLEGSAKGGVAVARGWAVTSIDPLQRKVTLDDGAVISYTNCLLAPGSKPKRLPVLENATDDVMSKVYYFRDIFDFRELSDALERHRDVVIIGGGLLGSELACSLTRQGSRVTHIFKEVGVLAKLIPTYLSKWLTSEIRKDGINVLTESEVVGTSTQGDRIVLSLSNGSKVEADVCVVAAGAEANTDLADVSKLETHPTLGGYLVNSEMLARSHLYIAGDAACFYDERFGRRRIEHHDHAVVSGRLAGENMTGASKPYMHLSMVWSDLGPDIGWEAVGVLDSKLETVGVFRIRDDTHAESKEVAEETTSQSNEVPSDKKATDPTDSTEDLSRGVVFYRKDGVIVGVLIWNLFGRIPLARQVLKEECKFDEVTIYELAKLFSIHDE